MGYGLGGAGIGVGVGVGGGYGLLVARPGRDVARRENRQYDFNRLPPPPPPPFLFFFSFSRTPRPLYDYYKPLWASTLSNRFACE